MLRQAKCPTWLTLLGLDRGCLSANLLIWLAVDEGAGAQGICTSIGQRETDPAAKQSFAACIEEKANGLQVWHFRTLMGQ